MPVQLVMYIAHRKQQISNLKFNARSTVKLDWKNAYLFYLVFRSYSTQYTFIMP